MVFMVHQWAKPEHGPDGRQQPTKRQRETRDEVNCFCIHPRGSERNKPPKFGKNRLAIMIQDSLKTGSPCESTPHSADLVHVQLALDEPPRLAQAAHACARRDTDASDAARTSLLGALRDALQRFRGL